MISTANSCQLNLPNNHKQSFYNPTAPILMRIYFNLLVLFVKSFNSSNAQSRGTHDAFCHVGHVTYSSSSSSIPRCTVVCPVTHTHTERGGERERDNSTEGRAPLYHMGECNPPVKAVIHIRHREMSFARLRLRLPLHTSRLQPGHLQPGHLS